MENKSTGMIVTRVLLALALLAGAGFIGFRIGLMQNIDLSDLPWFAGGEMTRAFGRGFYGPGSLLGAVFGILLLGFVIRMFVHAVFGFRRPFYRRPWMHHGWAGHPAWGSYPPEMEAWERSQHKAADAAPDEDGEKS